MSIFPDPKEKDFSEVKAQLQRHCPSGVAVLTIVVNRLDVNRYVWCVNYRITGEFPSAIDFKCSQAKSIFQRQSPPGSTVGSVNAVNTVNDEWYWCVQYKKKTILKLKRFVTCLSKEKENYTLLVKNKDQDETITFDQYTNEHHPKKIFHQGVDVTRKVSGGTRLSKYSLRKFLNNFGLVKEEEYPALPYINVNTTKDEGKDPSNSLNDVDLVVVNRIDVEKERINHQEHPVGHDQKDLYQTKQGKEFNYELPIRESSLVSDEKGSLSLLTKKSNADSVMSKKPYSYARVCQFSLLRDIRNMNLTTKYLSVEFGIDPFSTRQLPISVIDGHTLFEVEMQLQSIGLPIKSDLFELYLEYCISLGKDRSSSIKNLEKVRRLIIARR